MLQRTPLTPSIACHSATSLTSVAPSIAYHSATPVLSLTDVGGVPRPALHRWVAAALFESDDDFPGLLRPYFVMAQEGFALAIR